MLELLQKKLGIYLTYDVGSKDKDKKGETEFSDLQNAEIWREGVLAQREASLEQYNLCEGDVYKMDLPLKVKFAIQVL